MTPQPDHTRNAISLLQSLSKEKSSLALSHARINKPRAAIYTIDRRIRKALAQKRRAEVHDKPVSLTSNAYTLYIYTRGPNVYPSSRGRR